MKTLSAQEFALVNGANTGTDVAGSVTGAIITGITTAAGAALGGTIGAIAGSAVGAGISAVVKDNLPAIGNGLAKGLEVASHNQHRDDLPGGGMPIAFQ